MKRLCGLFLVGLACTVLAAIPKSGPKYETDRSTVGFLRRYLISGGDIHYPAEAARSNHQGSGFFLMKLRPDGVVGSLTIKSSTGYASLDEHVAQTLKGYRFKPKTEGPILWLVSFLQPATVIVKVMGYGEKNPPFLPK